MKIILPPLPDKIFGIESNLITVFVPLLLVIVVGLAGFNLIVVPKFNDYQDMNRNLEVLNNGIKTVSDKTRYLSSIDPQELKKNIDFISSALLPQRNAYLLVDVVQKITDKYGFQIDSFSISPGVVDKEVVTVTKTSLVPKIPIQVSITGPKTAYLDLLKGFERSLPILSLASFKMSTQGSLVKLDLNITAFYLQDSTKFDINTLSLADLTLKKEETDLLSTLNQFSITENLNDVGSKAGAKSELIKYTRLDPFNP